MIMVMTNKYCILRPFTVLVLCVCCLALTVTAAPVAWSRSRSSQSRRRQLLQGCGGDIYKHSLVDIRNIIPYLCDDDECDEKFYTVMDVSSSRKTPSTSSMWPPWPLNIIKERMDKLKSSLSTDLEETSSTGDLAQNDDRERKQQQSSSMYPSMGALFFAYARQQTRIGIRQIQEVSSQVWFNLPPAIPPIILFSSFPRRVKVWEGGKASEAALRRIPLFSSEPVRTFVLAGLGIAVLSWSNQELQRKRKLTPLILPLMNNEKKQKGGRRRVSSVFLPPFLPEDVTYDPEIEALLRSVDNNAVGRDDNVSNHLIGGDDDDEQNILPRVSPKIRKHLSGIYETTTATPKRMLQYKYSDWKLGRAARKREVAKIRRNRVFDELVALQVLKKRQKAVSIKKKRKYGSTNAGAVVDETEEEVGYAIVTGASKGIGRAIAVELARWEIPMILVARDVEKLSNLAYDLEACYGVKCCVLGADLSKVDAAERIHQATTEAGISVDILVNNAGIASEGLAVDTKTSDIEKMVMLNSLTYAKLSQLYGQDMKKKRRGRILMMSSMAGLCSASPNTAIYGACKAFGKSLSLSMAKEMEAYGVGVTCLIPGPVADTDFRESSGTRRALCWYLPFYSRSPDIVAHQGVISLLDGDTQTIPGWQNRAFANIVRPIIPQRVEVMFVQLAFSPFRLPSLFGRGTSIRTEKEENSTRESTSPSLTSSTSNNGLSVLPLQLQSRYKTQPPPRFLKLAEKDPEKAEVKNEESNTETLRETKSESGVEEDMSLSSPTHSDRPVAIRNEPNSTNDAVSPDVVERNEEVTDRSDTTPNTNNRVDDRKPVDGIVSESSKPYQPSSSSKQENNHITKTAKEEKYNHDNTYNTKHNSRTANDIPAKENGKAIKRNKSRTPSKNANERTNEDNIIEREKRPQWFDDDDDDDYANTFSSRLGPINMMEQRTFLLPKHTTSTINVRRQDCIIV